LHCIFRSPARKLFKNQRNIRIIDTDLEDLDFLNFQQLKLEQVTLLKLDKRTLKCLKGQDKITHAKFFSHNASSTLNLKELKSLEVLNVGRSVSDSQIDLSSNLKIRRVIFGSQFALIRSETLPELIFEWNDLPSEELERLAWNCPNLLTLKAESVDIDSIFLFFPKLESLCCGRVSKFTQSFDHHHLKYFCVEQRNWELPHDDNVISVVKRCVNLESQEINYKLRTETVEQLLSSTSKLKALSLYVCAKDYIEVIKKVGGHLQYLRCFLIASQLSSVEWAKQELKDLFDDVVVENHRITAKKKGSAEKFWYRSMGREYQCPRSN
jgi:hypothetical protein